MNNEYPIRAPISPIVMWAMIYDLSGLGNCALNMFIASSYIS